MCHGLLVPPVQAWITQGIGRQAASGTRSQVCENSGRHERTLLVTASARYNAALLSRLKPGGSTVKPYPLSFEPIYKPKLWGGSRIFEHFGRAPIGHEPIGESWELVDLEEDASRVLNGPAKGRTLTATGGRVGPRSAGRGRPVRRAIPAADQVPGCPREPQRAGPSRPRRLPAELGGNVRVKHEAWYILDADPGGVIYHGLEPGVSKEQFIEAMTTGRVDGVLRKVARSPRRLLLPAERYAARPWGGRAGGRGPDAVGYHLSDLRLGPGRPEDRQAPASFTSTRRCECIDFDNLRRRRCRSACIWAPPWPR